MEMDTSYSVEVESMVVTLNSVRHHSAAWALDVVLVDDSCCGSSF